MRRPGIARAVVVGLMLGAVGPAHADEDVSLPSPLRLDRVLELAKARRPEITAARARSAAAAQRPAVVSALDDPTVTASLDHLPFSLVGANGSLLVQQGFPLSHIRGNRRRAAEAAAAGARADAARVGLDVELDAADAFLMLNERRQTARILDEQRRLAAQLVQAATARYAAGTGVQADVLRAEIEVARLDGLVRAIGGEIASAEALFNTSIARRADRPVPALDSVATIAVPPDAAVARRTALDRRPELRLGRAELDRARAQVSVMKSMYAPMAMVGTGPAYTMVAGPGWMLMFGISVPLWRGKLRAGVAEAQSMVHMAQADLEATTRMIDGQAVAARAQVVATRARFLALRDEVVPRAREAIDPTVASYASGQLPLVSVVNAVQALWTAQAEQISAEAELGMAWARLQRAIAKEADRP